MFAMYSILEQSQIRINKFKKKKPIEIHFRSPEDLEEIFERIEEKKRKTLEYRNKNRKDENINPEFRKNPAPQKLDPRHKKTQVTQIKSKKYKYKNTLLHKDQFIKQKNLSRSLEVLYDNPNDNIPGTSSKTYGY